MRVLVFLLLVAAVCANAFFAYGNLGDSRLQCENNVFHPAGIVNYTLGIGVFDEPKNIVDYKMSFGFTRSGYSYDDGNESVSLYILDFNFISWSVSYKNFYFEMYGGLSYLIAGTNFSDYMRTKVGNEVLDPERVYPKYGYRLGYYVKENLLVSLTANYNYVWWRYRSSWLRNNNELLLVGGIGISVQYNIF